MSIICDRCKKPINKFSDGEIEYMVEVLDWEEINDGPNNLKPIAIHLVHHDSASLESGKCNYDYLGDKRFITVTDDLEDVLGAEDNRVSQDISIDLLDDLVLTNCASKEGVEKMKKMLFDCGIFT